MNRGPNVSTEKAGNGLMVESPGRPTPTLGVESIVVFGLAVTAVTDQSFTPVYKLPVNEDITEAVQEALGAGEIRLAVRKNGRDADLTQGLDCPDYEQRN